MGNLGAFRAAREASIARGLLSSEKNRSPAIADSHRNAHVHIRALDGLRFFAAAN
jgi:hypothetical protein